MADEVMLTTIDNPYNPFVQYELWYGYDLSKGYNTCAYLDRVTFTSYELSETDQDDALTLAMDNIIKFDTLGIYKKVTRNDFTSKEKNKNQE